MKGIFLTYFESDPGFFDIEKMISFSVVPVDWDVFCREVREKWHCSMKGRNCVVLANWFRLMRAKLERESTWSCSGGPVGFWRHQGRFAQVFCCHRRRQDGRTLLNLIKEGIEPGTTIVSDCWKGYVNLSKHGYIHETVNHSVDFVNEEGFHTNKIEGHWWQMKAWLPTHGCKKEHYSSYLAEFKWRYSVYPPWRRFVEGIFKQH